MWLLNTVFTILLLCYLTNGEESTPFFRNDYTYLKETNTFYKFDSTPRTWSDALATCKAEGAELFAPKSSKEMEEVIKLFYEPLKDFMWIGGHDRFSEGEFVSLDGRPLSETYLKWRAGEPNNLGNVENCIVMDRNGEYIDWHCNGPHRSFCKKVAVNLTQNLICETHDIEYIFTSQTDRCYKFHADPLNWHQAYKICMAEGAHLVIINSEAEAKILTIMFGKYPERSLKGNFDKGLIFVGFSDILNEGDYVTIEGQTLKQAGYENWNPSQPDNHQNNEHCGSMFRDGTLNDAACNLRAMYVCEKILSTSGSRNSFSKLPDEE